MLHDLPTRGHNTNNVLYTALLLHDLPTRGHNTNNVLYTALLLHDLPTRGHNTNNVLYTALLLIHLGKLVCKFPKDPIIYGNFINIKKLFKKTVKNKFFEEKQHLLNNIIELENKNPQMFWKLLDKLKGDKSDGGSPIPMDEWTSYFSQLHNHSMATIKDEVDAQLQKLIVENHENDPFQRDISHDEVKALVKNLHIKKLVGLIIY